jgi:hypothetical protein
MPSLPSCPEDLADEQVSLWALHELHYRGFEDVSEALEWHPELLVLRRRLEVRLEHRLRDRFGASSIPTPTAFDADAQFSYAESHDGRSLSAYVRMDADREQVLELLRLHPLYHLKETDPVLGRFLAYPELRRPGSSSSCTTNTAPAGRVRCTPGCSPRR